MVGAKSRSRASCHRVRGRCRGVGSPDVPLDAIPDLSDTQVIIYTEYAGQAPQVIEDQVTYPLSTAMLLGAEIARRAGILVLRRVVRLRDFRGRHRHLLGTLARARISHAAAKRLPSGVTPTLGPDATGVGWVYQYAVCAAKQTLADLRSTQDWQVRFGSPRRRASPRSPASAASSASTPSLSIPGRLEGLDIPLMKLRDAFAAATWMSAAGSSSWPRRVHGARPRVSARRRGSRSHRAQKPTGGTPVLLRDVARVELVRRRAARHHGIQRRGRGGLRYCRATLRRRMRCRSSRTSRQSSTEITRKSSRAAPRSCRSTTDRS